jgi:hypothetical protein
VLTEYLQHTGSAFILRSMKKCLATLILVSLGGCHQAVPSSTSQDEPRDKWVLVSYDEKLGYTFHHEGVTYQSHCYDQFRGGISMNEAWQRIGLPREKLCSDVVSFLLKPLAAVSIDEMCRPAGIYCDPVTATPRRTGSPAIAWQGTWMQFFPSTTDYNNRDEFAVESAK